jgi:predicted SAM-dependent methyltransferase
MVLATEVLEHLDNPSRALGEWCGVLKRGGSLIVTVPNGIWLPIVVRKALGLSIAEHPQHKQYWHEDLLRNLLEMQGLTPLKMWYFTRYRQQGLLPKLAYYFRRACPPILEMNIGCLSAPIAVQSPSRLNT